MNEEVRDSLLQRRALDRQVAELDARLASSKAELARVTMRKGLLEAALPELGKAMIAECHMCSCTETFMAEFEVRAAAVTARILELEAERDAAALAAVRRYIERRARAGQKIRIEGFLARNYADVDPAPILAQLRCPQKTRDGK